MTDQRSRSARRIRGLCSNLRYRENWWRSAAFSACNDTRDRTDAVTNLSMNWINRIMDRRIGYHPQICNRNNMLPFSGPTGTFLQKFLPKFRLLRASAIRINLPVALSRSSEKTWPKPLVQASRVECPQLEQTSRSALSPGTAG